MSKNGRFGHIPGNFKRPFLELENELRDETGADSRVFGGVEHESGPFRVQFGREGAFPKS